MYALLGESSRRSISQEEESSGDAELKGAFETLRFLEIKRTSSTERRRADRFGSYAGSTVPELRNNTRDKFNDALSSRGEEKRLNSPVDEVRWLRRLQHDAGQIDVAPAFDIELRITVDLCLRDCTRGNRTKFKWFLAVGARTIGAPRRLRDRNLPFKLSRTVAINSRRVVEN